MMPEQPRITPCPHCGAFLEPDAKVCPHCGEYLPSIWPPPISGQEGPGAASPEAAGAALFGFLLGLSIGIVWAGYGAQVVYGLSYSRRIRPLILVDFALFGFPALTAGAAAFLLHWSRPGFARGMAYSAVLMLAAMLGAFAVCH